MDSQRAAGKPGAKLGVIGKAAYGVPQFRVLHWVKAPRNSGTIWCEVPVPLPALPGPYGIALEKLFGVKPAVKSAAGMANDTACSLAVFSWCLVHMGTQCAVFCAKLYSLHYRGLHIRVTYF